MDNFPFALDRKMISTFTAVFSRLGYQVVTGSASGSIGEDRNRLSAKKNNSS
jgi:hypothetical protein